GKISVTTPSGTGSSSADCLVIPKISSFSPVAGKPGTIVTITGTTFDGATSVQFNGVEADSKVVHAASIAATVPVGATTGKISVTGPSGDVATSEASFTVDTMAPTVSIKSPKGGELAIAGKAF